MKLVIDTSSIISALIKESVSRKILVNDKFEFIAPDYIIKEITKYKKELSKKANITGEQFEELLLMMFEEITILPRSEYWSNMKEADKIIGHIDKKDVPFIALALSILNDGIWSDDSHFEKQDRLSVWKTEDLVNLTNK